MDASRLDSCGWASFRTELFFEEPGRRARQVGPAALAIIEAFSPGRRVLELCCGGGALSIFLAKAGCQVTALDLSDPMLQAFRQSLANVDPQVRQRVTLVREDVCTFDLGQTFDFIILEDDCFGYLLTEQDQLACLTKVRRHLKSDGRFLLTNKTPGLEFAAPDYEYDPATRIITRPNDWTAVDANGEQTTIREGIERRRVFHLDELNSLLDRSDLDVLHRWGDLDRTPFQDPASQEYVFLMQAAPPQPQPEAGTSPD